MKRYTVTLSVPVEDGENHPALWDWQTLIETAREVRVHSIQETYLFPSDDETQEV